jgi:hypothetical protein
MLESEKKEHPGGSRRTDKATADLVDIGLLYMRVFGEDAARSIFMFSLIREKVYERVLRGAHRTSHTEDDSN